MDSKNHIALIIISSAVSALITAALILTISDHFKPQNNQTDFLERLNIVEAKIDEEQTTRLDLLNRINQRTNYKTNVSNKENLEPPSNEEQRRPSQPDNPEFSQTRTPDEIRAQRIARLQPEYRKQRLISAGLSEDEATWIIQSSSEVELETLKRQYAALRETFKQSKDEGPLPYMASFEQLRNKIGDDYYERYLEANGWPTSITVGSVISSSQAANAGIQPGDNIIAYDGKRVFNMRNLNNLTVQGNVGESVLLEVERNGNTIHLTIPRGPIGIRNFGR